MYQLQELSLELTNDCAGKCLHCSSEAGCSKDYELPMEKWMDLVDEAEAMGASVISLSGGDPLVFSGWENLVHHITKAKMACLFYTCGFAHGKTQEESLEPMRYEDIFFLYKQFEGIPESRLIFSLEGATAETHNRIFGYGEAFEIVVNRLIPIAVNLGIKVELHFTPNALNLHEVSDFLLLAEKLAIEKVSFLRLVPQGRALLNYENLKLTPSQFNELQQSLYEYQGRVKFRIGCPLSFGHLYGYVDKRPRCHAGRDLLLVRPDGEVHCCAGWKQCKSLVLGNVTWHFLEDIWLRSPVLEMIRQFNETCNAEGYCRTCPWLYSCGGGCPAQRIILNQFIGYRDIRDQLKMGVDPMCPRFNGIFTDGDIRANRSDEKLLREQDIFGNVGDKE